MPSFPLSSPSVEEEIELKGIEMPIEVTEEDERMMRREKGSRIPSLAPGGLLINWVSPVLNRLRKDNGGEATEEERSLSLTPHITCPLLHDDVYCMKETDNERERQRNGEPNSERESEKEREGDCNKHPFKGHLYSRFTQTHRLGFYLSGFLYSIYAISQLLSPVVLKQIIDNIHNEDGAQSILLSCSYLIILITIGHIAQVSAIQSLNFASFCFRGHLSSLIFSKLLRLKAVGTREEVGNTENVANLLTVDSHRVTDYPIGILFSLSQSLISFSHSLSVSFSSPFFFLLSDFIFNCDLSLYFSLSASFSHSISTATLHLRTQVSTCSGALPSSSSVVFF